MYEHGSVGMSNNVRGNGYASGTVIAARVSAWQLRNRQQFGSLLPSGSAPLFNYAGRVNVRVRMYIGTEWVDITSHVRTNDGTNPIAITQGESDEQFKLPPLSATLQLNNVSGLFSPRNPLSPYYGLLRQRNMPLWILVGNITRFIGEIAELPQQWDSTGRDIWITITATDVFRRLRQGEQPIQYPLPYAVLRNNPIHYWKCTDPNGSTTIFDHGSLNVPMAVTENDDIILSNTAGPDGDPTKVLTALTALGAIVALEVNLPNHPDASNEWIVDFAFKCPRLGTANFYHVPIQITTNTFFVSATINDDPVTLTGDHSVQMFTDGGFTTLADITLAGTEYYTGDDAWHYLRLAVVGEGSGCKFIVQLDNIAPSSEDVSSMPPNGIRRVVAYGAHQSYYSEIAIGHIIVFNHPGGDIATSDAVPRIYEPFSGMQGETAANRIKRLCADHNIHCTLSGDPDQATPMGVQQPDTLLDVLSEAASTDGGALYGSRNTRGLVFRHRTDQYCPSGPSISYTDGVLSNEITPIDDDQNLCNEVIATTHTGKSAKFSKATGPLNISDPQDDIDGAGLYAQELTFNIATSDEPILGQYAAWRVHRGTSTDLRISNIQFQLQRECIRNDPELLRALIALDLTSTFTITDLPTWVNPFDLSLIVTGYTEEITNFGWELYFNTIPSATYNVARLDNNQSRYAALDSTVYSAVDSSATTILATYETSRWVRSSDDSDSLPFPVTITGELMSVTDVASPTYDTFTRTESNGWGDTDTGETWTCAFGSASDFSVDGSRGLSSPSAANSSRYCYIASVSADADLVVTVATDTLASGGSEYAYLIARMVDTSNYYAVRAAFTTAQEVEVTIRKRESGSEERITPTITTSFTHATSTRFRMRFKVIGSLLRAKVWLDGTTEPSSWTANASDTAFSEAGYIGVRAILSSSYTGSLPVEYSWDNFDNAIPPQTFTVIRAVNGVSKAHAAGEAIELYQPVVYAL